MVLFYGNSVCRNAVSILLLLNGIIITTTEIGGSCEHVDASDQLPSSGFYQDHWQSNDVKTGELPRFTDPSQLNLQTFRSSGQMLNIRCAACGIPEPNITWTKDSSVIDRVGEVKTRNWTLVLKNLTPRDSGHYTCKLCNIMGCISHSTKLLVDGENSLSNDSRNIFRLCITLLAVSVALICWVYIKPYLKMTPKIRKVKPKDLEMTPKCRNTTTKSRKRKRVVIDPLSATGFDETESLLLPDIRIENVDPSTSKYYKNAIKYECPEDSKWEVRRDQLRTIETIGEGNFGQIVEAFDEERETTVVIKKLNETKAAAFHLTCFVREIELLKIISSRKHRNIVNLLGVCTTDGPLYAILEYASHGDLHNLLVRYSHALIPYRLRFANQVACGMEHLASMGCIHRDLAARNVLVFDNFVVKIADFGYARDLRGQDSFQPEDTESIPYRWRAPETLPCNIHVINSDIWAYGVLLWEIMSFGSMPFSQFNNKETLYDYLKSGKRLARPDFCSDDIYKLIQHCCKWNPQMRPAFQRIRETLNEISE